MPDLIVIRLHPIEPTTAAEFEVYLQDFTITAYDLSFGALEGDEIGTAKYQPPGPEPNRISQHFSFKEPDIPDFPWEREFYAVATAVVEVAVSPDRPEYSFSDIRLNIKRNGKEIINRTVHYNAETISVGVVPDPVVPEPLEAFPPPQDSYADLGPVGLYLPLPPPGQEFDPDDAYVELPEDGTPPKFADLKGAMDKVLTEDPDALDPGDEPELATLTPEQARHVAFEIVWNRNVYPLSEPPRPLEEMYTGPHADDDEEEQDRRRYEAELSSYYAVHNAEAERLAGYVFSLSAAVWCEEESERADHVGFSFPVRPSSADEGATIKGTRVILAAVGASLDPSFTVPAEYFYASAASMPSQVTPQQRYRMATLEDEQQILGGLERAIDAHVITAPAGVNLVQAARRLHALGTGEGPDPVCSLSPGTDVHGLVQAWLSDTDENIAVFWDTAVDTAVDTPATGPHAAGHLDLVLCALTRSHQPLVAPIEAIPVNDVDDLQALTAQQWRDFFHNSAGWPANNLLPPFTAPGTAEERLEAFIRRVQKFFQITSGVASPDPPSMEEAPGLERSLTDPLRRFAENYQTRAGAAFIFGAAFDESDFQGALSDVFPADPEARGWLEQVLRAINLAPPSITHPKKSRPR